MKAHLSHWKFSRTINNSIHSCMSQDKQSFHFYSTKSPQNQSLQPTLPLIPSPSHMNYHENYMAIVSHKFSFLSIYSPKYGTYHMIPKPNYPTSLFSSIEVIISYYNLFHPCDAMIKEGLKLISQVSNILLKILQDKEIPPKKFDTLLKKGASTLILLWNPTS